MPLALQPEPPDPLGQLPHRLVGIALAEQRQGVGQRPHQPVQPRQPDIPPGAGDVHRDLALPAAPPAQTPHMDGEQQLGQAHPVRGGPLLQRGGRRRVQGAEMGGQGSGREGVRIAVVRQPQRLAPGGQPLRPVTQIGGQGLGTGRGGPLLGGSGGVPREVGGEHGKFGNVFLPPREGGVERPEFLCEDVEAVTVARRMVDHQHQVGQVRGFAGEERAHGRFGGEVERPVAQGVLEFPDGTGPLAHLVPVGEGGGGRDILPRSPATPVARAALDADPQHGVPVGERGEGAAEESGVQRAPDSLADIPVGRDVRMEPLAGVQGELDGGERERRPVHDRGRGRRGHRRRVGGGVEMRGQLTDGPVLEEERGGQACSQLPFELPYEVDGGERVET